MTSRVHESVVTMTGRTPLLRLPVPELPQIRVHLKVEGWNPTGSVKDRAGLYILQQAIERGELVEDMTILDASSGNMACSLAFFGRLLGFDSMFAVTSKLTADKRSFLGFFGAQLHQIGDFTIDGTRWCRSFLDRVDPAKWFFTDQLHNWDNPQAHYQTTGPEILDALPNVRMVVASLGSGGTLCGTATFLKEHRGTLMAVGVESASGTTIPGAGAFVDGDYETPFIQAAVQQGLIDDRYQVNEERAVRRVLELRNSGVFVGLQTGAALDGALAIARRDAISGDVVVVSGDTGWKNLDRLRDISQRPVPPA